MRTEQKMEQLLEKEWSELTVEEKKFVVQQLGSEEVFHNLKLVDSRLQKRAQSQIELRSGTLDLLQTRFKQQHGKSSWVRGIISAPVPAFAYVTSVVTALACGMYWGGPVETRVITRATLKTDTVYIQSQPDTIFHTKVVYKWITPKTQTVLAATMPQAVILESSAGVSMKDKEELESFIVSGTE